MVTAHTIIKEKGINDLYCGLFVTNLDKKKGADISAFLFVPLRNRGMPSARPTTLIKSLGNFRSIRFRIHCPFLYPLGESNTHLKFRKLPFYPLN